MSNLKSFLRFDGFQSFGKKSTGKCIKTIETFEKIWKKSRILNFRESKVSENKKIAKVKIIAINSRTPNKIYYGRSYWR